MLEIKFKQLLNFEVKFVIFSHIQAYHSLEVISNTLKIRLTELFEQSRVLRAWPHCGIDAKENQQDLCRFYPRRYLFQSIMFLLGSERAFHSCGSYSWQFPLDSIFHHVPAGSTFLREGCLYLVLFAECSVFVTRVAMVSAYLFNLLTGKFLCQWRWNASALHLHRKH